MSDANETVSAMLDQLASEVMALEPGDLMTYGDVLTRLEQLNIICEGDGSMELAQMADLLKNHLEGMILGQTEDQQSGVDTLIEGVTLCQALLRGDASPEMIQGFIAAQGGDADIPLEDMAKEEISASQDAAEPAPEPESAPEPEPEPEPEPVEAAQPAAAPAEPTAPAAQKEPEPEYVSIDDSELLEGFVTEAIEHLESIEVNTLVLEDTPDDNEALNAVFRPFHTIKGVSGFLNLMRINHMAHALENLLDQARSGKLLIDGNCIDIILDGVDVLRNMITQVEGVTGENTPVYFMDTTQLERRIQAVLDGEAEPEPKSEAPKLGEVMLEKHIIDNEGLDKALAHQQEKPHRKLGEIMVSAGVAGPAEVAEGIKTQKSLSRSSRPQAREVKVNTTKLDNLLDMVGELVIAQSMVQANPHVQQIADRKLHTDLAQVSRITTDLQKSTMAMRMVPIKQTFQKMVRVARDTAKKQGKDVNLVLKGESTEIDRNMVEKFYDPLMHMVRNSVDHGLESPDERKQIGKPVQGKVILSAYHKGGSVCVEIKDDGKGLNKDRILQKAIKQGMVNEGDSLKDEEIFKLIMQPGFSTAEKVTEISGRGVGMDVVQKTIDSLRGKIDIKSTPGEGTVFTIALPLTLAIIDGMVVQVAGERYILPTVAVAESLRPVNKDYSTVQGRGEMIMIRGNLIPLVRLHEIVEATPEFQDPWDALVVVIEHHGSKCCLLVDRLIGRQEVVIKSLGESLKHVKVAAGGAIMGDGRVGLILDVEGVFKSHQGQLM
jgi:two-component system chemotaxis sensor kinase CheA